MPDVLISENIRGAAVDALASRFDVVTVPDLWKDPSALASAIGDFRGLLVRNQTKVDRALLEAGKKLLVVGRAGVGLDNVDVAAATDLDILVTSTPEQNAISVAELTIGLMIALARLIPRASDDTKAGNWNRQAFIGTELFGKNLGILGAGRIGFLTARRAEAMGMKILAYDPFLSPDNILLSELSAELVKLEELLPRADVVSCHLPATADTAGLMNAARFGKMKPGALFINTSRGEVVVEADLLAALKAGAIAGAALDVRATEPPRRGELETMPNVIVTPHIAAFTQEAQSRVAWAICEDMARALNGEAPRYPVNRVLTSAPRIR